MSATCRLEISRNQRIPRVLDVPTSPPMYWPSATRRRRPTWAPSGGLLSVPGGAMPRHTSPEEQEARKEDGSPPGQRGKAAREVHSVDVHRGVKISVLEHRDEDARRARGRY